MRGVHREGQPDGRHTSRRACVRTPRPACSRGIGVAQSSNSTTGRWCDVGPFRRCECITSAWLTSYESFASTTTRDGQSHAKTGLLQHRYQLGEARSRQSLSARPVKRARLRRFGGGSSFPEIRPYEATHCRSRSPHLAQDARFVRQGCRGLVVLATGSQGCSCCSCNLLEGANGHHSLCSR